MTESPVLIVLIVVLIGVIYGSLRVAGEGERFAVFMLGRFQGYRGPGLILVAPFIQRIHRLKVGDTGVLANSTSARFDGVDIPVTGLASLQPGQGVRIDRFDGVEPRLVASSAHARTVCR